MGKYHSTLSRRDFLKVLGLGGAGLGAAAVSAPVFNDLDELMDSPGADGRKPWFAREVDKPTVDINWDIMKRFDYSEVMWATGLKKALGPQEFERVFRVGEQNKLKWMQENKPGSSLRDVALNSCGHWADLSFIGPQTSPTPDDLGVPSWEGTPEENARIVRAAFKLHGAAHVGFVELDTNTTEKMIYSYDNGGPVQGPRLDIIDAEQPEDNTEEGYRVIPKKARTVIVYTMRMSDETMERPATELGGRSHGYMYNLKSLFQGQMQNFLRTLGYMGIGEASRYNALGAHVGFAVMAGIGENSRMMHLLTPEYGLRQRVQMMITDMPIAPGKPVDFGAMNFCRACKKCADYCPPGAISKDTEPSWDTKGAIYASPGVKTWFWPQHECNAFIRMNNGCAICHAVCPLSKGGHKAFYHDLQRWTTANTSLFNGFFTRMDGFLGYGWRNNPEEIEKWWDLDLPPWGYVD